MSDTLPFTGRSADAGRRVATLRRVAETLGCPVETFYGGSSAALDPSGSVELLTLWRSLKNRESRQAVLRLIRAVVAAEGS